MLPHRNVHEYLSWWEDLQPDWSHIDWLEMAFEYTRCTII